MLEKLIGKLNKVIEQRSPEDLDELYTGEARDMLIEMLCKTPNKDWQGIFAVTGETCFQNKNYCISSDGSVSCYGNDKFLVARSRRIASKYAEIEGERV